MSRRARLILYGALARPHTVLPWLVPMTRAEASREAPEAGRGHVHQGSGRAELPVDVSCRSGSPERDAVLMGAVLDAVPFPTVLLDPNGLMVLGNRAWNEQAAASHGDRLAVGAGRSYYDESLRIRDDDASRELMRSLRELARGDRTQVSLDYAVSQSSASGTRWYQIHASRVDQAGHVVVTHVELTARVQAEKALLWRARHDHLTELPNRAHLHELIDAELRRGGPAPMAVLFLDVDGFKDVNDSLGHDVGDDLLRQLAGRLAEATRAQDTVGRLGGDEFVILCPDCDVDGAAVLAQRCQGIFDKPFRVDGGVVQLSASIGIAPVTPAAKAKVRSTDLVRDADLAMYAAKAAGRSRVRLFSPDLRTAVQRKGQLARELRQAIDGDQLVLHYQPVVDAASGDCDGLEALVRWQHPERGLLPPAEFLPLAEQYELIVPLTRWVLATATREAAAWHAAGRELVVGVNISAAHFATGTLEDDIAAALRDSGLPAGRLIVELTESSVAEDPERAAEQLGALRRAGVEVGIDDFGRGFSSLSQLMTLPAGVLKIDRSLVVGSEGRADDTAAAVAAVVGLAGAFGMRTLAEGIETAAQLAMVVDVGCTYAQGFHIARPMPAAEVPAWMAAYTGGAAPLPLFTDAGSLSRSPKSIVRPG